MAKAEEDINKFLARLGESIDSFSLGDLISPSVKKDVGDFTDRMSTDLVQPGVKKDVGDFVGRMKADIGAASLSNLVPAHITNDVNTVLGRMAQDASQAPILQALIGLLPTATAKGNK